MLSKYLNRQPIPADSSDLREEVVAEKRGENGGKSNMFRAFLPRPRDLEVFVLRDRLQRECSNRRERDGAL
jgi:hypothetical protein